MRNAKKKTIHVEEFLVEIKNKGYFVRENGYSNFTFTKNVKKARAYKTRKGALEKAQYLSCHLGKFRVVTVYQEITVSTVNDGWDSFDEIEARRQAALPKPETITLAAVLAGKGAATDHEPPTKHPRWLLREMGL